MKLLSLKTARLTLLVLLLVLFSIIPIRLAIAKHLAPQPQAILTLGGDASREKAAAQLARQHPTLPIWTSTGESPRSATAIFAAAGVARDRLHLDYRAVDTVTNFTSLVGDLQQRQIHHIYLVTSDFHMPRARAIATLVLGSRGITVTPVSVPSPNPPEHWTRTFRDCFRSVVWLLTGRTGASLGNLSGTQNRKD